MNSVRTIFFGSTSDSVIVLEKIFSLPVVCLVTQPPRPVGRRQILTPTPVEIWAKKHKIPAVSFPTNSEKPWLYQNEETVIDTLEPFKADLVLTACYGQKIPMEIINKARFRGLNVHPSLLPRFRGADPVPWAILSGDQQTGVSILTLEEKLDQGQILAQKKIPITPADTSDPLRTKLFTIGADLLLETLPAYLSHKNKGVAQDPGRATAARRLTRDDGFEPWETIKMALQTGQDAERLDRKLRAFSPWPGLWTKVSLSGGQKRLKILSAKLSNNLLVLDWVQLEGKIPVTFRQFQNAYL